MRRYTCTVCGESIAVCGGHHLICAVCGGPTSWCNGCGDRQDEEAQEKRRIAAEKEAP